MEDDETFVVEGPKIEKMLGYTNIESEKGFLFFQRFLKEHAINVQMALTQSLFAEMGVLALTVAVMAYCRRFSAIVRWLAFYALFAVTAQLLVASGSTLLSPFAASLLMYRHVLPAFMFAFNMICLLYTSCGISGAAWRTRRAGCRRGPW